MKFDPAIQKLVDRAERQEAKARNGGGHRPAARARGRRRTAAAVVAAAGWAESEGQRTRRKARESRDRDRTRIELLRYKLRKARAETKAEIARLRGRARDSRPKLAAQIKRFRAKWRAWVNEQVRRFREKHRKVWTARMAEARLRVVKAEAELKAELGMLRQLRRDERATKAMLPKGRAARVRGIVRAQESDYEVEGNLTPEEAGVWRRQKHRIRTRIAGKTRTEAFKEWLHDNPEALDEERDRLAAEYERGMGEDWARYEREQYERGAYG